ncbi:hypothetical protein QRB41_26255, partial [Mycobacterium avium subsp. hominissuis]|nr:hypothetical protein [Mycobacterium avium subsp. hominissuis]MDO2397401.1 hypothetical protein [Mycobacterium avium subsp. hominissuis]
MSVSDVAEFVGIARTAAGRFILTLEYLGYLSYDASGYSLRLAVLEIGDAYLLSHKLLAVAHPHLSNDQNLWIPGGRAFPEDDLQGIRILIKTSVGALAGRHARAHG